MGNSLMFCIEYSKSFSERCINAKKTVPFSEKLNFFQFLIQIFLCFHPPFVKCSSKYRLKLLQIFRKPLFSLLLPKKSKIQSFRPVTIGILGDFSNFFTSNGSGMEEIFMQNYFFEKFRPISCQNHQKSFSINETRQKQHE